MERYTDHTVRGELKRFANLIDAKMIVCMLAVEFSMLLMAGFKGIAELYLPVVLIMMLFTIAGCVLVNSLHADKVLFIFTLILLNLGFLVQQIQRSESIQIYGFLKKLIIAIALSTLSALLFSITKMYLSRNVVVISLMLTQLGIGILMLVGGQMVGGVQGAVISVGGITPFEVVKLLYVFVSAGLLTDDEDRPIRFKGITVNKELLLVVHTAVLSVIFICCSELGTLMIVYLTGLMMLWIYGKNRKWIALLAFLSIGGIAGIWILSDRVLLPMLDRNPYMFPGAISKIIRRFGTALHPEYYMSDYGYQGTFGLQAIAVGGWLGIPSERYRVSLPEATNDFAFANIIQTCGVMMGIFITIFFFAMLKRGFTISDRCKREYLKRISSAITLVIITEAVVHIGYNIAAFPITGIPLYFVSQGFTAILTGMIFVAILLVISIGQKDKQGE